MLLVLTGGESVTRHWGGGNTGAWEKKVEGASWYCNFISLKKKSSSNLFIEKKEK